MNKNINDKPASYYVNLLITLNRIFLYVSAVMIVAGFAFITYETSQFRQGKGLTNRLLKPHLEISNAALNGIQSIHPETETEETLKKIAITQQNSFWGGMRNICQMILFAMVIGFFIIPNGCLLLYLIPYLKIAKKLKQRIN